MASAHVVPAGTIWAVKANGASVHNSLRQQDAIDWARDWLKRNGGGELIIHGQDGSIRAKDTVAPGNDPRNVRG